MGPTSNCVRGVVALLIPLLLSACASLTEPELPPEELARRLALFEQDQEARKSGLERWTVRGVLDLETPDDRRRLRFRMAGRKGGFLRLLVKGPLGATVLDLTARKERISLLDPQSKRAVEVPASALGMDYLLGVALAPIRLQEILLGIVDLPGADWIHEAWTGYRLQSPEGILHIDPIHGRALDLEKSVAGRETFTARFDWPDTSAALPVLPETVWIDLPKGVKITLELAAWEMPESWRTDPFAVRPLPPGFILQRAFLP